MTIEQFIAEAQSLARPCLYLTPYPNDAASVAIWQDAKPDEPICTIDCRALPDGLASSRGVLRLIRNDLAMTRDTEARLAYSPEEVFVPVGGVRKTLLYPIVGESLPPYEAVMEFGSSRIKDWIAEAGIMPKYPFAAPHDTEGAREVKEIQWAYQDYCSPRNPLFTGAEDFLGGVYAMLGGWNEPWPDDDWPDLLDRRLVAFTYHDAEPFYEIWRDTDGSFFLVERIT